MFSTVDEIKFWIEPQINPYRGPLFITRSLESPVGDNIITNGGFGLVDTHPFARLKSITLEKLAAEPLVGLRRKDYSEYYRIVDRVFASVHAKPRIAVECDSASSLITEVEAGRGVALSSTIFKLVAGKRLLYRPLTGTTEVASVGIARASKGDVTPAGEKFCEILRKISNGANAAKPRPARS